MDPDPLQIGPHEGFEEDQKQEEDSLVSQEEGKSQVVQSESQSISSEMKADADGGEPSGTNKQSQGLEETKAETEKLIEDPSDQL